MFLFLIAFVASAFGQNQMDWPDFNKYNQYLGRCSFINNFSQSVVANASGPLRTYYLLSLGSSFAHPNGSELGIPYKQENAPRSECSYQEDCNRYYTEMQPNPSTGQMTLGGPLNLPTQQNNFNPGRKKCVACSSAIPTFKEFDCQRERFVNEEAANLTKLLQPFAKTLFAQLYIQPYKMNAYYANSQDESIWSVLVELKKEFQADARWIFPFALRRRFSIVDELKCKCEPKDVNLCSTTFRSGRNNYPWYVGFQMERQWP